MKKIKNFIGEEVSLLFQGRTEHRPPVEPPPEPDKRKPPIKPPERHPKPKPIKDPPIPPGPGKDPGQPPAPIGDPPDSVDQPIRMPGLSYRATDLKIKI
jgi:hypothetical protein